MMSNTTNTTSTRNDDGADGSADSNEWGWDPNVAEESAPSPSVVYDSSQKSVDDSSPVKPVRFDSKHFALKVAADSLKSGMTSSPSFQELERAIGATLALSLHGSETDMASLTRNNSIPKLGSFNSIYQKAQSQQRYLKSKGMVSPRLTRDELSDFIHEAESRAMILFHSPDTAPNIIRDSCQKYGAMYYIRPEFHNRGVTFLSYSDIRSAISAVRNLSKELGPSTSTHYSIMLHGATNNSEEHKLVVKHLPTNVNEGGLETIFGRYGEVRSIEKKHILEDGESDHNLADRTTVYYVEYFNIHDARSAASELSAISFQIWGVPVSLSFSPINSHKQVLLRQLLSILSRWRTESTSPPAAGNSMNQFNRPLGFYSPNVPVGSGFHSNFVYHNDRDMYHGHAMSPRSSIPYSMPHHMSYPGPADAMNHPSYANAFQQSQFSQLAMPGQIMIPGHSHMQPVDNRLVVEDPGAYSYHVDAGANYLANKNVKVARPNPNVINRNPVENRPHHHIGAAVSHALRKGRGNMSNAPTIDSEFTLDIHRIENQAESRTTVMVRNIPNKYTQRMLLEEVDINHKGTYDFFYLPIDFKNRCNVGYCFINFLEPHFIVAFVQEFNGLRWKNFNSEKVCAVTFARIQGKSAMISRFQNSSLLEKHDDYRPLLFYSNGPDRGKPEPFPVPNRHKSHQDQYGSSVSSGRNPAGYPEPMAILNGSGKTQYDRRDEHDNVLPDSSYEGSFT